MRGSHSVTTTHKAAALFVALALATPAWAQAPALPSSPQTINVIDVAGDLALTQKAIEKYRADHAKTVSRITFTKAPAPELAGKIKAQQNAGRVDIDLVLSGTDAVSAGIEQNLWLKMLPDFADKFPDLEATCLPGALTMKKPPQRLPVEVVCT